LQQQRKRAAATKAKGPHLLPSLLSWPKPRPRQNFISFQMFLFLAFASRRHLLFISFLFLVKQE